MTPLHFLRTSFHGYKVVWSVIKNYNSIQITRYSTVSMVRPSFNIDRYDCVGFDLDNTLCEYKLDALVRMEYKVMAELLVSKGYSENILTAPLDAKDMDFMQRGLILDFERGNILKLNNLGEVSRASHGTKLLSDEEVKNIYGDCKKCPLIYEFVNDLTTAWEPSMSSRFRVLLDFFDMPASLAYARSIEDIDSRFSKNYMDCGKDMLDVFQEMYSRDHFLSGQGIFFQILKRDPEMYINKCSDMVINWLQDLNKSKIVFLITGSNVDLCHFIASNCVGTNWRELFDVVVCFARKPGFFKDKRPFYCTKELCEANEIARPEMGEILSQGSWEQLHHLLAKSIGKPNPSCLYFGDNLVEDIYTPTKWNCCDTAAVIEETFFTSDRWGSYTSSDTLWGNVLQNYSLTCIPTLKTLAAHPLNEGVPFFIERDNDFESSKK